MKNVLSSTPVLTFLFVFNAAVAIAAYFALDGAQMVATSTGMGVVSLGAGLALVRKFGAGRDRTSGVALVP